MHETEPNNSSHPDANFPITIYVPADVNVIQRAINNAIDYDTIIVSEGTYNESLDFEGYQEWAGVWCTVTSTDPNDWNVVANTIIDANKSDANVVTFDTDDANSVIKGFTITGGARGIQCDGTSPTISNCVIRDNSCIGNGGGIHNVNSASPTITNCVLLENSVINCTFFNNSTDGDGGAMGNYASSDPNIVNCIFWGNDANNSGDEIYNDPGQGCDPNFSYCDIEGCGGSGGGWDEDLGNDAGGNIDSDPSFLDSNSPAGSDAVFGTLDDGLRLRPQGPCIDTGDPNTDPNDAGTVDLAGDSRIVDGDHNDVAVIDMGAYELPRIWFVDGDANGNDDGTSWTDAYEDLQKALVEANSGDEIWVAEGPYEPNATDRSISFELVGGVAIYGGFAGTETGRHQRNWILYRTILSGEINDANSQSDNSYHVVKGANNAILDGFTITGGYANASSPDYLGGGIYCSNTSPTISNCTFSENKAAVGGGMYNSGSSFLLIAH